MRQRRWLSAWALCVICSLAGCQHAMFLTNRAPGAVKAVTTPFFLAGLVGENRVNVRAHCPQGVARVDTLMTIGDAVLTGITLGLYAPRTVIITCAAETSQRTKRVLLGPDVAGEIVPLAVDDGAGGVRFPALVGGVR